MGKGKGILLLVFLAIAFATAAWVRWEILALQELRQGPLPFTMESALSFRYAGLASEGGIPDQDPAVGQPEGIRPSMHLNVLAPRVVGTMHRWWPQEGVALEDFARAASILIFSIGAMAIGGCAWVLTRSHAAGLLAGVAYAIALPGVLRSTGQELMSENFALPLLWLHVLCMLWAMRAGKGFVPGIVLSSVFLALAWAMWDMVQLYAMAFVVFSGTLLWPRLSRPQRGLFAGAHLLALLACAFLDPYLNAHGAWAGYATCLLLGLAVATRWSRGWNRRAMLSFAFFSFLFMGIAHALTPALQGSYDVFGSLLWHKIKFLNSKPADPALLPYPVRALWVPALHSATWQRVWTWYGAFLLLGALSLVPLCYRWIRGSLRAEQRWVAGMGLAFLGLSVLFVRMEVFWIFFAVLGLITLLPAHGIARWAWASVMLLTLSTEAKALIRQAPAIGRNVDYSALNDAVAWVGAQTDPGDVILANYPVSPSFAAYAHRPIVLQPKYETPVFREKIWRFEQALIASQEGVFSGLCESWGVCYYVHSIGSYSGQSQDSFRYLVGVSQPSKETNLAKFELNPGSLNRFQLVHQNSKYLVYRFIPRADVDKSGFCLKMAKRALHKELPMNALRWCRRALRLFPGQHQARLLAIRCHHALGDVISARRVAAEMFGRMQVRALPMGAAAR